MEDFESCINGIIEPRKSVFVTDGHNGKADPLFQFSLDSSETLDGDVFFVDYKTCIFILYFHIIHIIADTDVSYNVSIFIFIFIIVL